MTKLPDVVYGVEYLDGQRELFEDYRGLNHDNVVARQVYINPEVCMPTHKHLKRGTNYQLLSTKATIQTDTPLTDHDEVAVYKGEDGKLFVRPVSEFEDGRFERIGYVAYD